MNIIESVCKIPESFLKRGDVSIYQVFSESGYLENLGSVSTLTLEKYINENPEIIQIWLAYSEDKRCTPSWYFKEKPAGFFKKAKVGYLDYSGKETEVHSFNNDSKACAFFIQKELMGLAKH